MRIDPDTFDEWQAHPITEALYRVCEAGIKEATEAWMQSTLAGGNCDPMLLKEMRTRIAVLREIQGLSVTDFEERA